MSDWEYERKKKIKLWGREAKSSERQPKKESTKKKKRLNEIIS